jgi:hypothetical protein
LAGGHGLCVGAREDYCKPSTLFWCLINPTTKADHSTTNPRQENYVYDNPDNDSCTPELWICSKYLRSYEMLLQSHHEFLGHYFSRVREELSGQSFVEFKFEASPQIGEHITTIRDSFKPSMEYMLDMVRSPHLRRRPALS